VAQQSANRGPHSSQHSTASHRPKERDRERENDTGWAWNLLAVEPHWVALGKLLPGVEFPGAQEAIKDTPDHGQNTMTGKMGHPLAHRSAAALKLIRNHEAVIRDVCNPCSTNTIGAQLTQLHLKRVPVQYVQFVEEALRLVAIKLLGYDRSHPVAPQIDPNNAVQRQVWAATSIFVLARIHVGAEKPGRTPDLAPDASLAMRAALMDMGFEALGM